MPKSICCDISTNEDLLGFKPYVEAIAEFLTDKDTESPITLSIEGQWGCGKSSFMKQLKQNIEMRNLSEVKIRIILKYLFLRGREDTEIITLRRILSELLTKEGNQNIQNPYSLINRFKAIFLYTRSKITKRRYFTIWFNCWRYEKEDEVWAAFAINLMDQLSEQLSLVHLLLAKFKLGLLRFKWKGRNSIYLIFLFISALYAFFVYSVPKIREILSSNPSMISYSMIGSLFGPSLAFIGIILTITPMLRTVKDIKDAIVNPFDFSKFVSNPNYTEHISFIENFHSDFGKIIKSYAGNSRVYIFVDDLDRCEISKAAEIMQAINLMISDEANIYFCIGMDRKVISAGFSAKHENFLKYLNDDGLEYGYKFIEKFIQLSFKVPSPKNENFKDFVTSHYGKDSTLKASKLPYNLLSKFLGKFRHFHFNQLSNDGNAQMKSEEDIEYEKTNYEEVKKKRSNKE